MTVFRVKESRREFPREEPRATPGERGLVQDVCQDRLEETTAMNEPRT